MMQTAEIDVVGLNIRRGTAATMQSAAAQNQRAGYRSDRGTEAPSPSSGSVTRRQFKQLRLEPPADPILYPVRGVAAEAQSAATLNARTMCNRDKTKLADIVARATSKLRDDKPATLRDAEGVTDAEMQNDRHLTTHPTGVAASVAAAARLNQNESNDIPK
ncbi:hypothetical protein M0R45_028210 [Rubus argutus]|uniref:SMP domain-containing protein n=1 Tax=Rubus argutus TaxID=59490 RepID=A0AAW1W6Q9_RUBAR